MKVISNSSPLIGLSLIKELDLIRKLWGHIIIPRAVFKETVVVGKKKPGASDIAGACRSWIKVAHAKNRREVAALQTVLDEGEAEVITLGQEVKADLLLLDNREPRLFARTLNFEVLGTIGIIKMAWQRGLVSDPGSKLQQLRLKGFWIDDILFNKILSDLSKQKTIKG
jgi:predicted nucleic acid-binding protein